MTRVIAVGYGEQDVVAGQPPLHAVAEGLQRDDLDTLVDLIGEELADGATVVAIYPIWNSEPSLQRLQTIRTALGASRLLLRPCVLPPVAGTVLCGLAAALAPLAPSAGALLAGLAAVERQVLPVARLSSVANLRQPAPKLGQHLASWWPLSSFGVSWWPQPSVRMLRRGDPGVPLPIAAAWTGVPLRRAVICTADQAARAWFDQSVFAPLGTEEVMEMAPSPLRQRYWGDRRVAEAAAYPDDLQALSSHAFEGRYAVRCDWCGETVASDVCPFCGTDRAVHAGAAA